MAVLFDHQPRSATKSRSWLPRGHRVCCLTKKYPAVIRSSQTPLPFSCREPADNDTSARGRGRTPSCHDFSVPMNATLPASRKEGPGVRCRPTSLCLFAHLTTRSEPVGYDAVIHWRYLRPRRRPFLATTSRQTRIGYACPTAPFPGRYPYARSQRNHAIESRRRTRARRPRLLASRHSLQWSLFLQACPPQAWRPCAYRAPTTIASNAWRKLPPIAPFATTTFVTPRQCALTSPPCGAN